MEIRRGEDRGLTKLPWLDSRHSFSFGGYRDPAFVGFRTLRVINEDVVAPGGGFARHPHENMEIVSYVLSGSLEHEDSMGNRSVIRPGEIQKLSAGTGVTHSEFNPSSTDPVHFYQIWIEPNEKGLPPGYDQAEIGREPGGGRVVLAAPPGQGAPVTLHQDARIELASLSTPEQEIEVSLPTARHLWIQVLTGAIGVDDHQLSAGDGLAVSSPRNLTLRALEPSDALIFDLA